MIKKNEGIKFKCFSLPSRALEIIEFHIDVVFGSFMYSVLVHTVYIHIFLIKMYKTPILINLLTESNGQLELKL